MLRKIIERNGKKFLVLAQRTGPCFLSALALTLSFPRVDVGALAWVAFVPFLFILDGKRPRSAWWWGYLFGFLFFGMTFYWFVYVTTLGALALVSYLALYPAFFALGYCFFNRRALSEKLFLIPAWWLTLEFLRSHLFSGFGWASLGHSQYKNIALIQMAGFTGVFGVSFLVLLVNVLIKESLACRLKKEPFSSPRSLTRAWGVTILILAAVCGFGFFKMSRPTGGPKARIAVVQANTPQIIKWDPDSWPETLDRYLVLTKEAALEKPDLIIWPETSFPGYVWDAPEVFESLKDFVDALDIPLLLGMVTKTGENYFNSAVLISKDGDIVSQYDKLHLVPFGEYIPLRRFLPFLSTIVPIDDFTAGKIFTLLPLASKAPGRPVILGQFSVLICFEDTLPGLSRRFTREGSHLFVNITNDAWFEDSRAPHLHMQAAAFRSLENGRWLVRAANTGISGFIDDKGRLVQSVKNAQGKKTYVSGFAINEVTLANEGTFYNKCGDVFTYLCFSGILWMMIRRKRR